MKILTYQSNDFWRQLEEHLFIRDQETSSKIEADVKSIIKEIREFGDDKVIQFAKDFDKIIIKKDEIKLPNLKHLYSLENLNNETVKSLRIAIQNVRKFHQKQYPSDYEISNKITKSYDNAIKRLKEESQNMKERFIEKANISFESDFELFCSRYDSEIRELDDAINEKEENSSNEEDIKRFRFDNIKKIRNLENEKFSLIQNIQNKHQITIDYELVASEIIKF